MRRTHTFFAALALAAAVTGGLVHGQANNGAQHPVSALQAPSTAVPAPPANADPTVQRGRYLVMLGDCMACHTQAGGAPFAGGRGVETPFGTLLSANITPDRDSGIGAWSADQFYRALHEGMDANGHHLYPAFPYNYYTGVTREDSDAMFAYFKSIPPVPHAFERNRLPFPFNQRWLLVFWNWLFLDKGPYQADASKSPQWNRGAYLVETLGHCQACHTAKNFLGAPKKGDAFRGGIFGEWFAPDITANQRTGIGAWNDDALREFLRQGMNVHSAASGEMGEVVAFSTGQMNDADLQAVVTYLRGIPASPQAAIAQADAAVMKQGAAIFQDSCSACHRMDGSGVPRLFPPLQHDANLQQSDPTTTIHYILGGTRKVPNDRAPTALSMPAYDWKLDDQQVAAVATYVRNSWGNAAPPVKPEDVAKLRGKLPAAQHTPAQEEQAGTLAHPGPNTMGPAGTDSRDNGTAQAGKAASDTTLIPATHGQAAAPAASGGARPASSGTGGGGAKPRPGAGGHPAGAPSPGPG